MFECSKIYEEPKVNFYTQPTNLEISQSSVLSMPYFGSCKWDSVSAKHARKATHPLPRTFYNSNSPTKYFKI